jgi:hypothetical protein
MTLVAALAPGGLGAQSDPSSQVAYGDSIYATPRRRYDAGFVHRLLLGDGNRELWRTPVEVEVLDLDTFAGGLEPLRLGGGLQTRSLRLRGADGQVYNFRSLDKDASRTLDPELRRSIAARVLQDQISALLPLSALVVAPLLEAADVLHPDPRLVVMPDDPHLGEFQEEFAGMMGFIEVRPDEGPDGTPGFAGSGRVTGSERFLEHLEEDPENRVNDRAYLRARMMDIFVGDWDRHPDQWRWAAFEDDDHTRWEPIPRDRDWALARLNGLLIWAAGFAWPHYVGFDHEYPSAFRITWSGRALDRRLLSETDWSAWEEIVLDLQSRLTDSVIEEAVSRLPEPYVERIGDHLLRSLKHRRDQLPEKAKEFYLLLASWVDIHATDEPELAVVDRSEDGTVRVEIVELDRDGNPKEALHFSRRFHPEETKEIRIDLRGGDDRAVVRGRSDGIVVQIMGGGADDTLEDQTRGAGVAFYDDRGDNSFVAGPDTRVDESDYEEPEDQGSETHQAPARDWGSRTIPVPLASYELDLGLFLGAGFVRHGYGFRYFPYRTRLAASLGVNTGTGRLRALFDAHFPVWEDRLWARVRSRWSGAELNRFYGFGNETEADGRTSFFEAERRQFDLEALLEVQTFGEVSLSVGAVYHALRPYENPGTLLDSLAASPDGLYGAGEFDEIGAVAHLFWDARNRPMAATRGGYLAVDARFMPSVLDVEESFGSFRGEAAAYWSPDLPADPTLSLRVGGERTWGDYPYHEASYLGGGSMLRGFRNQRFAGDGVVYGNGELRWFLTEFFLLLPGDLGLFGLGDVGRVFLEEESSSRWHSSVGGGIWISFLDRKNTLSLALARSAEETGIYVKAGFLF